MPVVSVIVPIYRVRELYLRQCFESIIHQTLCEIEIILVDDGSPDNCGVICDEYAKNDSRIVVIHQENQGVSVARNNGMLAATGKWLTFVDADDWIEPEMCKDMVGYAEKHSLDVVIVSGYKNFCNGEYQNHFPNIMPSFIYRAEDKAALLLDVITPVHYYLNSCFFGVIASWGKLIRNDIITGHSLEFPAGIQFGEDKLFIMDLLLKANAIAYLDRCYYHYRAMVGSASNKYDSNVVPSYKNYLCKINSFVEFHFPQNLLFCSAYRMCVAGSFCKIAERIRATDGLTYAKKRKELLSLIRQEPFVFMLRDIKKSELPSRTYVQVRLLKHRQFGLYMLLKTVYLYASGRKKQEVPFA